MTEPKTVRWQIRVSGRVQHVGFRHSARTLARELGLTGWVDNLDDGRVLMEVQGGVARIRALLLRLKGRAPIRIDRLEVRELEPLSKERGFRVKSY